MNTPNLPQDTELERVILGAAMMWDDPAKIRRLRVDLPVDTITHPFHKEFFLALLDLADKGEDRNPVTLTREIEARGSNMRRIDIQAEIAQLVDGVPWLSSLKSEIRRLKEIATLRDIIKCSDAWLTEAQAKDVDVGALVGAMNRRVEDFGRSTSVEAAPLEISWAQLCEMTIEHRETLLHEVERGEIVRCSAITNRGKTTLWRNIALSLACGREYLPIVHVGPARRVLYLDFETRLRRLRPDIMTMLGQLTQEERAMVAQNFHVIADCQVDGYPLTLTNPKHLEMVEAAARRIKADVVIIDTLSAAFGIDNENDNSEGAKIMKKLIGICQRVGCVIVFLDHIGKMKMEEGQTAQAVHRGRGASAYSGFSHAIFNLLPDATNPDRITLECAKVKGHRFDDTLMNLDKEKRWFVSAGAPAPSVSPYDQVVGAFNGQPLSRSDVEGLLPEMPPSSLTHYLKMAVSKGDLEKLERGKYIKTDKCSNAKPYRDEHFSISEPQQNQLLADTEKNLSISLSICENLESDDYPPEWDDIQPED